MLCAGEAGRPVRRTRGKGEAERARDHVRISAEKVEQQPAEDARPAVLSPEELCPVSTGVTRGFPQVLLRWKPH